MIIKECVKMPSFLRVSGLLRTDKGILFVKETENHLWKLPGGKVDIGETSAYAVVREFKEELDLNVNVTTSLGFGEHADTNPKKDRKILFFNLETNETKEIKATKEIFDATFIKENEINWDKIEFATKDFLQKYLQENKLANTSIGTIIYRKNNESKYGEEKSNKKI